MPRVRRAARAGGRHDSPDPTGIQRPRNLGLGLGSREAEVRAAYPRLRREGHAYDPAGHYLIAFPLADTTFQVVFETDGAGVVTGLRGGRLPEVQYVEGCA